MKKLWMAFLLSALALALCCACSAESIGATSGKCGTRLTWALDDDGTLTVSGTGVMTNYAYDTGAPWEARKNSIRQVVVESGVTSIGSCAFSGCESLEQVTLPTGLRKLGDSCFSDCYALTDITLPAGLETIGEDAFYDCASLKSIALPETLETIGERAFYECENLKAIIIPDSVSFIGSFAFYECYSMSSVTLSSGMTNIAYDTFYGCDSIAHLTIPEGIVTISESAFIADGYYYDEDYNRIIPQLHQIRFPLSLEQVGSGAFVGFEITDIHYAGTRTEAEKIVFGTGNTNLTSIIWRCLDGDFNGIGATSGKCGTRLTWALDDDGTLTVSGTGVMTNYTYNIGAPWEARKNSIRQVVVESGVTSIGSCAFSGCDYLEQVTLPTGLRKLGDSCFSDCDALTDITLPDGLETIGDDVFRNCASLKAITLPETLETIGESAFFECHNLEAIIIPDSVSSIGSCAFYECYSMSSVTLSSGMTDITFGTFYGCVSIAHLTIPEGIVTISDNAFIADGYYYDEDYNRIIPQLHQIRFPLSLEQVGSGAFVGFEITDIHYAGTRTEAEKIVFGTGNTNLTSIIWHCLDGDFNGIGATSGKCGTRLTWVLDDGGTLTVSGTGVMTNYTYDTGAPWEARKNSIRRVVVESGVTSIGSYAFSGCVSLEQVTLPTGLRKLGDSCFSDCDALTDITLPDGLETIGDNSFGNCSSLKAITLPETLETIGYSAFDECRKLESIIIPDNVSSVGSRAFCRCILLSSVTLSSGMTSIEFATFDECDSIAHLIIPEGIVTISENAFSAGGYFYDEDYNDIIPQLHQIRFPLSLEQVGSGAFSGFEITDIYYAGTRSEAEMIAFGTGNTNLTSAKWHFGECDGNHLWGEPVYEWSEDNLTVTARATCVWDSSHVLEETVRATLEVSQSPTETKAGETTFTAVFENELFDTLQKTAMDIPALADMALIRLPQALTTIDASAFEGLPGEGALLPEGCVEIGARAFADCADLIYVRIPSSVTTIAPDAFEGSLRVRIDRVP